MKHAFGGFGISLSYDFKKVKLSMSFIIYLKYMVNKQLCLFSGNLCSLEKKDLYIVKIFTYPFVPNKFLLF